MSFNDSVINILKILIMSYFLIMMRDCFFIKLIISMIYFLNLVYQSILYKYLQDL